MKYIIIGLYAACILFVHFRGRARLPFLGKFLTILHWFRRSTFLFTSFQKYRPVKLISL